MTTEIKTLGKLHILERLYRSGYQSDVIEPAMGKLSKFANRSLLRKQQPVYWKRADCR